MSRFTAEWAGDAEGLLARRTVVEGRAAINCTTCLAVSNTKREGISSPCLLKSENSSDLSLGRRPTSKSDEFSLWIIAVIELRWCENIDFAVKCYQLLAARPPAPRRPGAMGMWIAAPRRAYR